MTRVTSGITDWLNRPNRTNRDQLVVAVIASVLLFVLAYVAGKLLSALGLVSFDNTIPIWGAALLAGAMLALGMFIGHRTYLVAPQAHGLYTEHLRDALADLRRLTDGELPDFSIRDYVENGIFQPAQRLLTTRGRDRGEVRFSILHPDQSDDTVFVMRHEDDLFPALGHSMEGRQAFRMEIDGSLAGLAFRTGRTHVSNDLKSDSRWKQHPRARQGREYESLVCVPLVRKGNAYGVLNVLATKPNAFERVDQAYVTLLGSVIDVARSVGGQWV